MELPYFKAFPTDWEITMRKAGIPPAKRGTVYRLIFFAWQEQGLNLTEDETYERRMRVLAQAFGMSYCRFKPYLAYYKTLSECQNGLWLPSFLLQQLQNAMRFQSKVGTESEQSQNKAGTELEQSQNNISGLSSLPAIPLKHEQEHDQERESAREEEPAPLSSPDASPVPQEANEPEETTALGVFRAAFDDNAATIHAQTVIEAAGITDLESWKKAVGVWKTNGYKPRNLAGLIDKYRDESAKATKARKGWSSGPGATGEDIAKLIRTLTSSSESDKPAVAGGQNGNGNGRVADGASGGPARPVAPPLRDGAPYTGPETIREVIERRRRALRVVEVPSGPEMECPF